MQQDYNPATNPLQSPVMNGHIAKEVITADNLDEWLVKLDFDDAEEATNFALTVNKCLAYDCSDLAQEVLRIAKSRCSIKAKRVVQVGEIATGIMMPGYHGDKTDVKDAASKFFKRKE